MRHDLGLVAAAGAAADELLATFGVPIAKGIDLATPVGFDHAVARLAARLSQVAAPSEAAAIRDAIGVLDVDWRRTTPVQRRRLVSEALVAAGRRTAMIPMRIQAALGDTAEAVARSTRSSLRRQGLAIGAELGAVDRRVATHIVRSQGNFVRDEYGRRVAGFGASARRIVASGLEAGLGRADIGGELAAAASSALVNRSPYYWEVVAGSFIGRGRTFANLAGFAEAGIERWVFEAVLDEATTAGCRFLHGRVFDVRTSLDHVSAVERLGDPEDIKRVTPWLRERQDKSTGRSILYVDHRDGRIDLAEVVRTATGARDDRGEFHARVPDRRLSSLPMMPPMHAHCRSTCLPAS